MHTNVCRVQDPTGDLLLAEHTIAPLTIVERYDVHMVAFRCTLSKQTITLEYGCIVVHKVTFSNWGRRSGETAGKVNRQEGVKNNLVTGQIGSGEEGGK
ncbi:hypothetical protein Taro_020581 [Colocasia esculenta]|uniref:Uncharacterized protein n=1 Tax=Colocasia esculenta TaxID=4460 RepID=A0A843UWQ3_COLES|nr:hypothetical protein [Colocasia esculenta]